MLSPRMWVRARRLSRHINHHYFSGHPRQCVSTRIHMERWVVAEFFTNCLFLPWGWGHCRSSYEREVIRGQTTTRNHPSPQGKAQPAPPDPYGVEDLSERSVP